MQLLSVKKLAYDLSKTLADSNDRTESIDILRTLGVSFTDTFSMADTPVVSFGKGLTRDSASVTEVLTSIEKGLSDNTSIVEVAVLPNLGKSDSVSMSESLARVVDYARSFSDAISLDDRTSVSDPLAYRRRCF